MKRLLILSGKGGTGKTTIASGFIEINSIKAFADCDVDAPNLHLILKQDSKPETKDYYGMDKAFINRNECIECGKCYDNCRFEAIIKTNNGYKVDEYACEGCGVCEYICENNAVSLEKAIAGERKVYDGETFFSTAELKMGSGTSGKLVVEVKNELKKVQDKVDIAIIDGSPGIGCPVIASISGVDLVLIVTEPSISGISDMKRIVKTSNIFGVNTLVCINKYDLNIVKTKEIEDFCKSQKIKVVGKIPYEKKIISSLNKGKNIFKHDIKLKSLIHEIYNNTLLELVKKGEN